MPTRLSPHWRWGSSVRTKSPRPCSPLRTGVALLFEFHRHAAPTIICSSIHPSTSPQVHLLLQRLAVQHHQNEQQPFVPPPDPHSITPKLPNRRRSVFNADFRLYSCPVGVIVECCVSVSCRFLSLPEDLPVSAAGVHLSCLVSIQQVVRLLSVRWTDVVYTRPAPVFRSRQVCAYTPVTAVYSYFTRLRHVWIVLCVCLELVWPYFLFPLCLSSDPQSSRARKLCMTMEPALLLKGDIMVRNGFSWLPCVSSENLSRMKHQLRWFKLLINHFTKPLFYSWSTHRLPLLRTRAWLFLNYLRFKPTLD